MFGFGLSKITKVSILVGVTGVALIGLGYAINSVTGLIDEMTENKEIKNSHPREIEMQEFHTNGCETDKNLIQSTSSEESSI